MQPGKSRQEKASGQAPQVTCIRLTQGSSDDSVWVLEEGAGGTFLTIGSDPECEWQIRAAGMPAHALSVLLVGGLVYVRSGPQRGVRLDARLLSEDWTQVERDARIDVGLAQLEIKLGKDKLLPSLRDVHAAAQAEARGPHVYAASLELERSGTRPTPAPARRDSAPHARQPRQLRLDPADVRPRDRSWPGWLYLAGTLALTAAYALWVVWLD